jgi:5'-3' exonuclease
VERVFIYTPDKDLAQAVQGTRVVQVDRLRRTTRDEAGVIAKFGVPPASIPDYLALVGDSADGYPGLPGWGVKSAALVLAHFRHVEAIPDDHRAWPVDVARAGALAATLKRDRALALRFRDLATLRTDVPVFATVDALEYRGPTDAYRAVRQRLDTAVLVAPAAPRVR